MGPIVITSNEPGNIKRLFKNRLEVPMNYDFLVTGKQATVPLERKVIPGDLLASVDDGRLYRELQAMREDSDFYVVILHGRFHYHRDGTLDLQTGSVGIRSRWTKRGIRNLLRTLQYVEGAFIEWADSNAELVTVISELQEYFDQSKHLSMRKRPGLQPDWIIPTYEERVRYFYAGLPSIKASRAKLLQERFSAPVQLFGATLEEIMGVRGIGKDLGTRIYNMLHGLNDASD